MPIVLHQTHGTDGQAHHYEASSPLRRKNKISKYYIMMGIGGVDKI
jgi:hypothetical protein